MVNVTAVNAEVNAETKASEREIIDANALTIVRGRPLLDAGVTARCNSRCNGEIGIAGYQTGGYQPGYHGRLRRWLHGNHRFPDRVSIEVFTETGSYQGCGNQATTSGGRYPGAWYPRRYPREGLNAKGTKWPRRLLTPVNWGLPSPRVPKCVPIFDF